MVTIHPTAIVHQDAQIADGSTIGPFSIIEGDVVIGENCHIHSHVQIADGARLADHVTVHQGAVLSSPPQDLKYRDEKTYLEIGQHTTIREYATLNRGTDAEYKTVVGNNCFIMAYVHVAHDCMIGNHVIISNAVNMAGHVIIDDYAGVGGMAAIHQFVHIGSHCFVAGASRVGKDVPPFILAMGEPLQYGGINFVGLTRRGFSEETQAEIKRAYRILMRSKLTKAEALDRIREKLTVGPEIQRIIDFVDKSERGLIK